MGCDDAYGPTGSTSDARKRLEEGRAELNRREAERWRAEADFGDREDEGLYSHTDKIPSTSEYIRRLCREKLDLTIRLEAEASERENLEQRIRELADEWAEVGALPRTPADRRGEQVYGNGRLDSYASCARVLRDMLTPDVSN